MTKHDLLAERFETHRSHLQAVAYRMLGSLSEADDAVQEAWLRLVNADADGIENLGGWLRTVVSRVCLDMLRSRESRREDLVGQQLPDSHEPPSPTDNDPEQEALMADSVGRALLVVLDRLVHAERVAFVLHDMFAVPFDEIAPIVGRSSVATKKLASRARSRLRREPTVQSTQLAQHRRLVEAFLAASRAGDVDAVMTMLSPDVVRRADRSTLSEGRPVRLQGARAVAQEIAVFGRNARFAETALLDGAVGLVVAPKGHLMLAITFTISDGQITEYEIIGDVDRLGRLDLAVLDERFIPERQSCAGRT